MKNNIIYMLLLLVVVQVSCKKNEDLSSFVIMNSKIEESIENSSITNSTLLDVIFSKAKRDKSFVKYKETAEKVHEISVNFNKYLNDLKSVIKEKKSTKFVDEYFFNGEEIANGGEEFLNYIENYKSSLISTVALSNPDIAGMIKSTFDIGSIEDRKGKQTNWLTLNYKGFPTIASVIKLSEMQADVKQIEKSFHEAVLNVRLKKADFDNEISNSKNQVAENTPVDTVVPKKEEPKKVEKKPEPKKEVKKPKKVEKAKVKVHTVAKGETLYLISKKYNLTTVKLKKMNGMTNNNLVVGQKLKVAN